MPETKPTYKTGENLTPKQENAIVALLGANTVKGAAEAAGVSRTTIYQWLKKDTFREALRTAQHVAIDAASTRLAQGLGEAIEQLHKIITSEETGEGVRRLACSDWIGFALRLREFAVLEARIEALERGE